MAWFRTISQTQQLFGRRLGSQTEVTLHFKHLEAQKACFCALERCAIGAGDQGVLEEQPGWLA